MIHYKPILLVEDDEVDKITVERAFTDLNKKTQLIPTRNGAVSDPAGSEHAENERSGISNHNQSGRQAEKNPRCYPLDVQCARRY